jgi:hypothetical protein
MAVPSSSSARADPLPAPAVTPDADTAERLFEQRWAAWNVRTARHERAVRQRFAVALPILAVVAAVLFALFAR